MDNTEVTCRTQNTNADFNINALYLNESIVCTWDKKGVEKGAKAYLSSKVSSKVNTQNKILVMVHFNGISFLLITKHYYK